MHTKTVRNIALSSLLTVSMVAASATCVFAETDMKFKRGTRTETTYENEIVDLYLDLTDTTWYIANDEEMGQISGITKDIMVEDLEKLMEDGQTVMDLYMMDMEYGDTVNIQLQKLDLMGIAESLLMDDDKFAEAVMDELEKSGSIDMIAESLSLEDASYGLGSLEFCGKETPCLWIEGSISVDGEAYPFYETMVYVRKHGYVATITAAAYEIDTTADALAMFTDKKA